MPRPLVAPRGQRGGPTEGSGAGGAVAGSVLGSRYTGDVRGVSSRPDGADGSDCRTGAGGAEGRTNLAARRDAARSQSLGRESVALAAGGAPRNAPKVMKVEAWDPLEEALGYSRGGVAGVGRAESLPRPLRPNLDLDSREAPTLNEGSPGIDALRSIQRYGTAFGGVYRNPLSGELGIKF